ncbi:MAG: LemA family protein [Acidobacteriota bacterium]
MKRVILLTIALAAAFAMSGCSYNDLTAKQQIVKGKWADVESSMQRRADLIPNATEVAKMGAVQEQEVFGQIAEARSKLLNAQKAAPEGQNGDKSDAQKQAILEANNSFGGTIGRLLSLTEAYPDLKSSEAFKTLMTQLEGTENRINVARTDYNKSVVDYNTARNSFPAVLTAGLLGFKEETPFQGTEESHRVPTVGDANSLRRQTTPPPPGAPAPANK